MVKILGGPKHTLAHPLKFLGGPWPPPVPPPLDSIIDFQFALVKRSSLSSCNETHRSSQKNLSQLSKLVSRVNNKFHILKADIKLTSCPQLQVPP